jgi:hypothetical protein
MEGPDPGPAVGACRRDFVRLSLGALGVLLGGCAAVRASSRPGSATWEELTDELVRSSEEVFARRLSEDAYVSMIAGRLRRLDPGMAASRPALVRQQRFAFLDFALPPGEGFPYHDHRDHIGVTLVLEGRLHVRSFDVVGPGARGQAGDPILIRETESRAFGPGECATLTRTQANVHDVRAGEAACRFVEIVTWTGPHPRSVCLDVDERPIDRRARLYRASFGGTFPCPVPATGR